MPAALGLWLGATLQGLHAAPGEPSDPISLYLAPGPATSALRARVARELDGVALVETATAARRALRRRARLVAGPRDTAGHPARRRLWSLGSVRQRYQLRLQANGVGTPINWSVVAGGLPPGLGLTQAGELFGRPITAGSYAFRAEAFAGICSPSRPTFFMTVLP